MISSLFHPHNTAPVAGSAVSCTIAFDLHAALGIAGQVIGILSGAFSIAWVVYQFYRARKQR